MPLVSGVDVIRFAHNLRSDWPAVVITGYADADAIAGRPSDVPLLGKPFRENDLIENIFLAVAGAETREIEQANRRTAKIWYLQTREMMRGTFSGVPTGQIEARVTRLSLPSSTPGRTANERGDWEILATIKKQANSKCLAVLLP